MYGVISFSELFTNVSFNDGNCQMVAGTDPRGVAGSEDLALGRHEVLFISSGDLRVAAEHGSASANPGGIWGIDVTMAREDEPFKLPLLDYPIEQEFTPHGLFVSNLTDRMYVVNHGNGRSTVEIFAIEYCNGGWSSCEFPVNGLTHLKTVRSGLFPFFGINDVVEGKPEPMGERQFRMDSKELYVTRFLPFPMHVEGWRKGLLTFDSLRNLVSWLVGMQRTQVFRCTFDVEEPLVEATCADATGMLFRSANGITVDENRERYFVCDTLARRVTVLDRDEASGRLTTSKNASFDSIHPCDNLEYDNENGELVIGTVAKPYLVIGALGGFGSGMAPGGMVVATECTDANVNCTDSGTESAGGGARRVSSGWLVQEQRMHDGGKLPLVSAAARFGGRVFLGSFSSTGFLVCEGGVK
jgi:hypothetical protein